MIKEIGKIRDCRVGLGGYQGAQFGVQFDLGGKAWGCGDFWGFWSSRPAGAKWDETDRQQAIGAAFVRLRDLIVAANVQTASELIGKPIEITFDGTMMKSWRILTEVL